MAAHAVQLRPTVLFRAERGVPLRSLRDDEGDVAQRFDVVDRRRLAIQADEGRKWRLVARLGALAFQRLEERRLLARLVRAGAPVHVHVAIKARPEDVPAEEPARIRLVDRVLEDVLHVQELAADVDVGDPGADGVAGDRAPFEQQVRIALHQHVVLERARLALVGVAADVLRLGRVLEDELPLQTGWKSGAAAAAKAGILHTLDHVTRLHGRHGRAESFVAAIVLDVEVERERVRLANMLRQDWFERRTNLTR